jgi:uncharacterized membrane protein
VKIFSPRSSPDLAATAVLAVATMLVLLLPAPGWLQAALSLPFVLLLPGYALCAIFAPRRSLSAGELLAYSFALSLGALAISSSVLQLIFSLDRTLWLVVLTGFTVVASGVAAAVRVRTSSPATPIARRQPRIAISALLFLLAAAGLAIWAVSIASTGAAKEDERAHFTALWVLPAPESGAGSVQIGVENREGQAASYSLRATEGGNTIESWRLRLSDREQWLETLPVAAASPERPMRVFLLRGGRTYRHVDLETEPSS